MKQPVVLAEMTDCGKLFQIFIIPGIINIPLNQNDIRGWLTLNYAPGSTVLFFKAQSNISAIFA